MIDLAPPDRPLRDIHFFQDETYASIRRSGGWSGEMLALTRNGKSIGEALILSRRLKIFPGSVHVVPFGPKIDWSSDGDVEASFQLIRDHAERRGAIYVAVQPYCFQDIESSLSKKGWILKRDAWLLYRHTVLLGLSVSTEQLFRSFEDALRRNIRRSEKSHTEIRVNRTGETLDDFYSLYRDAYSRSGGGFQSFENIRRVYEILTPLREALFAVAYVNGVPASAALMGLIGGNMVYLCGGSSDQRDLLGARPSEGLHWQLIQLAKAWGCGAYDFGGVTPAAPVGSKSAGIRQFKEKFGPTAPLAGYFRCDLRQASAFVLDRIVPLWNRIRYRSSAGYETDYNFM